jgi:Zn-dependent protease
MLFSLREILDIIVMALAIGFIFKDAFLPRRQRIVTEKYDPVAHYRNLGKNYDLGGFVFAMIVAAPAVLFHELGHKLVAMGFGMNAEFHAAYFWLVLGVVLKLMNFGFIFFVPAYVSITGAGMTPLMSSATAFAGPAVNLAMFLVPFLLLKSKTFVQKYRKYVAILFLTSRINIFLFIFNMLPIPMFDGWTVYSGLIQSFF